MIDIHPEDLLDRERDGCLSAEERVYLDAHLSRCAACRIERQLALECAMERELIDFEHRASGAGETLSEQPKVPSSSRSERRGSSYPPRRLLRGTRTGAKAAVVSAALLLAGGAAALGGGLPWSGPREVVPSLAPTAAPSPSVSSVKSHGRRRHVGAPIPAPSDVAPDELTPEEPAAEEPALSATATEESPQEPIARPSGLRAAQAASASDLFKRAASARRDGDYQRALTLYERLIQRYPQSPEARTAQAVRARLLLDLGHTAAAEQSFREASKDSGPLTEVALIGEAQALRRAGKSDAERAVWHELLRRFPGSPKTAVARARLKELGD